MYLVIKRTMYAVILLGVFAAAIYSWMIWQNNRDVPWPEKQQILASFESAVNWFHHNRENLLKVDNPALWRMIQKSADLTGDKRLQELFDTYHARYDAKNGLDYSYLWFKKSGWVPVRYKEISDLDDYQQFFAYALTCDLGLGQEPVISAQQDSSYCNSFPFKSSCITHQVMGLQLLQERDCGNAAKHAETILTLQHRIRNQLTWDPRLLDQYIQRVLVLLDTGALDQVKPVWIQRVIKGSLRDGGWPSNRKIINLPGDRELLFTRNFIGLGHVRSTFHASAQGLLILAHLLRNK